MKYNKKGIIGITLAAIMIASIFAAIAPSTTADDVQPLGFVDASKIAEFDKYHIGETVTYTCTVTNPDPDTGVTFDVYDQFAYDAEYIPTGWDNIHLEALGGANVWSDTISFMIGPEDVTPAGFVINNLRIDGIEDVEPHLPVTGSVSEAIEILTEPPVLDFDIEPACCLNISFSGWADKEVVNYTWVFGDGDTEYHEENLPGTTYHVYSSCGGKTVTLYGYSTEGLYGEVSKTVHVDCGPTAIATASPSCFEVGGTDITFSANLTTIDTLPIKKYNWSFSDGTYSDQQWVTKNVNDALTATLTVWVGLDDGTLCCNDTDVISVGPCSQCALRIYGTFNRGPGDFTVTDPETGLRPENKPYTDPVGPFHPQNAQAPRKDFITFNPAIMDHNQGYPELNYYVCPFGGYDLSDVQTPNEKVFKRMWYEKEWFKDHDQDGHWDVVVDTPTGVITMTLDEWNAIPAWIKERDGLRIREWNNDPTINDSNVDIYGPAINQEFTYMFLSDEKMPIMIGAGSEVLIPMAHDPANEYRGLNSFDALPGDGVLRDAVIVESERTLAQRWRIPVDIDEDGNANEPMGDFIELNGDESVVLRLDNKFMRAGDTIQFFDHIVTLTDVQTAGGPIGWAIFDVCDNEGGGSQKCTKNVVMNPLDVTTYYRGRPGTAAERPTFYLRLVSADAVDDTAIVEVGRMFGQTHANIGGTNPYWSQKAFMVDGVFYNVVAIKALDNCIKYITFRQKLPKLPIKLYGKHLEFWTPRESPLPEMPPFNMDHEVCLDVWNTWTRPHSQQDKIGPKIPMPPLVIDYIYEDIEERYKGELKEIYYETHDDREFWTLEWFWTLPWQYTELRLPKDDRYLVTLSWFAPESEITLWDSDPDGPVANYTGERFKFWYQDCTGPIYIDNETSSIRLYGTFGEGPGDHTVPDPELLPDRIYPENKPYSDPMGPFDPQHDQAPVKDFMTFNPAIMDHNQGYPELDYYECADHPFDVQIPKEKVFKRMWYEKEWFKDHDQDGHWDVVIEYENGTIVMQNGKPLTMRLEDWYAIPAWIRYENGWRIREHNDDWTLNESNVDIYGPAINQEFTYMFTDDETMPIMIGAGSKVLIPMAHYDEDAFGIEYSKYRGLNSFDADGDGVRDAVSVESERTVGINIDGDGLLEPMDRDGIELSGDETVVLVLENKFMNQGDTIQFFDHVVTLKDVQELGVTGRAIFHVCDNEGGTPSCTLWDRLAPGQVNLYYRGKAATAAERPTFYLRVLSADAVDNTAIVEVGRMFGQTYANIGGANPYWSQKAFMVDGVFYNVVAIKAVDNCIKYITFRQKLPKEEIKLYGKHLEVWDEGVILPEMPPFNMDHEILIDVQPSWTRPYSQQDKIGPKEPRGALEITYVSESKELRFKGELREIYNETFDEETGLEDEYWNVEWFHTQPWQYTAFVMPDDQLYLLTLAWFAPESEITIWDHDIDGPMYNYIGERVKFWYDAGDNTDLYVNKVGAAPPAPTVFSYYNSASHGGNGDECINLHELVNAIMDYLYGVYPFGDGLFDRDDLIDCIEDFIAQPPECRV